MLQFQQTATVHRVGSATPALLHVRTARGWWQRFRGLMLAPPLQTQPVPQALLIPRCACVHGFFMRYALDIVYLANDKPAEDSGASQRYRVTRTTTLAPWRVSFGKRYCAQSAHCVRRYRSAHTLELPAGSVQALGIQAGDMVEVQA